MDNKDNKATEAEENTLGLPTDKESFLKNSQVVLINVT
jgi:hypothetical protein